MPNNTEKIRRTKPKEFKNKDAKKKIKPRQENKKQK
jgi:hypothetical protein